ncbi:PAS domain S-box protein [Sphingomonas sp. dw_22]|uniref:PAS domain S-box protein n=1 Tax=Sphingomonas sp. dw_22 TaxID=2721175 RepID=UPI001BD596B3|nr:PAS domain S-box protein [Sphingomonas sp. dw_22]
MVGSAVWLLWLRVTGTNPPLGIPIGLVVGGLLFSGPKFWPAAILGIFAGFWLIEPSRPFLLQLIPSIAIPAGGVVTVMLIRRLGVRPAEILEPRSLLWVFAAAVAGSAVTSALGTAGALAMEQTHAPLTEFAGRFARQGLGMILVAPLVLVWGTPPRDRWSTRKWAGFAGTMALCAVASAAIFLTYKYIPIAWAIFPPLVLAALGWHLRGITTAMAISSVAILWGTGLGLGPFTIESPEFRSSFAQMFVAVTWVMMLLLATYADERRAEDKLRLADARLQASRANLTNMVRNAASPVAIVDRDMRYIATSRRFLTAYRLPEDMQIEGKSHYDVFPHIRARQDIHQRVLAGEELSGTNEKFVNADGTTEYISWNHRPWYDEDSRIVGIIMTSEVVTAEIQARQQLERAEQRYRAVFEQAGVGVGLLSLDGVYFDVNDRSCELTGYAREEVVGHGFELICDPPDWGETAAAIAALARDEIAFYSADRVIRTKSGELRPVHATANLVRKVDGTPDHIISVLQDISERVEAQRALSESEKRLRLAQEAAGVGVWEIDLKNGGSRHSPQSARLFGLPWRNGPYRMADFENRLGEEQVAQLRKAIDEASRTHGLLDMTLMLHFPDDEPRWVNLQGRYDRHDGHPRLLGLAIDITHDVEAEAQLREAHDKLLRVARLSAMGAMASTLAHELNQPLSAITNFVEASRYRMRQESEPDPVVLDALEQARGQALRAGEIIRKIRAFTVSGEIASERVDMGDVVRTASNSVRQLRLAAGVLIQCDIDPRAVRLIGDALQLEQVVANLTRNAAEATQGCTHRKVTVTTRMRQQDMLVRIEDTGRGISEELIENLFEPFRTSKETGTGLGLPICRTIVEAHGGRLWAANRADGGAEFSFTIPLPEDAERPGA